MIWFEDWRLSTCQPKKKLPSSGLFAAGSGGRVLVKSWEEKCGYGRWKSVVAGGRSGLRRCGIRLGPREKCAIVRKVFGGRYASWEVTWSTGSSAACTGILQQCNCSKWPTHGLFWRVQRFWRDLATASEPHFRMTSVWSWPRWSHHSSESSLRRQTETRIQSCPVATQQCNIKV